VCGSDNEGEGAVLMRGGRIPSVRVVKERGRWGSRRAIHDGWMLVGGEACLMVG
jgi:hypothetical protein